MRGYRPASYGDGMADVYDDWYGTPAGEPGQSELAAMVDRLAALAGDGRALELGIGTGRVAIPLAARGVSVAGVDASPEMVRRLAGKPGGEAIVVTTGDMARDLPEGPFRLVFVVVNTFFNLTSEADQHECLRSVSRVLEPGGHLVIEAFVPDDTEAAPTASAVEVRSIDVERVVLAVSRSDARTQTAMGQFVDISADGITMRPWQIRWATPAQLDVAAGAAGLSLTARHCDWAGGHFGADSPRHVSIYTKTGRADG
ncbi:MAG: class I SAM-dependent methyltransferase [Acidimicrobiia bacterium]